MKTFLAVFTAGLAVLCVVAAVIFMWNTEYVMERDVTGYLERAQVASNAEDMAKHLTLLKEGMEKYGMTKGHAAWIFKTPVNDMGEIYLAATRNLERVEELFEIDTLTELGLLQYDTRLDDLRGAIRELEIPAGAFWWRTTTIGIFSVFGFWVGLFGTMISFHLWDEIY